MKNEQLAITQYCTIRKQGINASTGFSFSNTGNSLQDFLLHAYEAMQMNYPRFYKADRLSQLGLLAAEAVLRDFDPGQYKPESVAMVLSNASASLDTDIRYNDSTKSIPSPALFVYTLPNIVAGEICIRHGIKGENAFFITREFDANLMCDYVEMVLSVPGTEVCLAGWVEVLEEHFDVFLYLVERKATGIQVLHTGNELTRLYSMDVWNS